MIGLFDSDVLIKLCCCNLWSEAITALGISTAYRLPQTSSLLSGDKRFIEAFRTAFPKEWETLSKCIVSFEMCLEAIEAKYGYDHIHQNAAHIKHCDGTLRLAILAEPNRDHFIECIASYNPCRVVVEVTETVVIVQG